MMPDTHGDYYRVLGVDRASEQIVIAAAYKALMKKYHPDRDLSGNLKSNTLAQSINEAYATLADPARRALYDEQLSRADGNLSGSSSSSSGSSEEQRETSRQASSRAGLGRTLAAGLLSLTLFVVISTVSSALVAVLFLAMKLNGEAVPYIASTAGVFLGGYYAQFFTEKLLRTRSSRLAAIVLFAISALSVAVFVFVPPFDFLRLYQSALIAGFAYFYFWRRPAASPI